MALVAALVVTVPPTGGPGGVEGAGGWESLLPVGHASHAIVDGDGDGGDVGGLANHGDEDGVHCVDHRLVGPNAPVCHQGWGVGHVDGGGGGGVRAQGAHQVNEGQVVLGKLTVCHRDVGEVSATPPVGGTTIHLVLGVVGTKHNPFRGNETGQQGRVGVDWGFVRGKAKKTRKSRKVWHRDAKR